jgi:hypothetical protein
MSLWLDVARVSAGLNVVLLLGLGYVWGRNYRQLRSKHALGLLVFAGLLLLQNFLWLYLYNGNPDLRGWLYTGVPLARQAVMGLCVLETGALSFLAWITLD